MTEIDPPAGPTAAWIGPEREENELRRYLATLRHRGWLIVLAVVVATLAAAIYVKTATPVYRSSAQLLVTPQPSSQTLPTPTQGLIPQSSDPTRDVQTAANLIDSIGVAQAVKGTLHLKRSPSVILGNVSVQPVSNSNILAITAQASTPDGAARLANAFAQQAVATRTAEFRAAIANQIAGVRSQISTQGASAPLQQEIAQLETLRAGPLPDMKISSSAVPPTGRSSPRAKLTIAAGAVLGLVLGILGAIGLEAFDSTLRREEQLKRLFRLPILARIPREGSKTGRLSRLRSGPPAPRAPDSLSLPALEAFRTLRAMALASRSLLSDPPRSFLITSASPNEGKTTTALNLAASLSSSGSSVILIEGDLRRPSLGHALGLSSRYDLSSVLTGEVELERALVSTDQYPNVRLVLARGSSSQPGVSGDPLFLPTVPMVLDEAERIADYVVVDSPPLLAVIDALALAREVDFVLLVVRLGQTHMGRLAALGTLLADSYIDPAGIAVIGAELPGARSEYDQYVGKFNHASGSDLEEESSPPTSLESSRLASRPRERPSRGAARTQARSRPD